MDIILLAMIAGFIFLRLRGILGKKNGFEGKMSKQFKEEFQKTKIIPKPIEENFDDQAQKQFLKGAEIAYEQIVTSFAKGDKNSLKPLLEKEMFKRFSQVIDERNTNQTKHETTFIGLKSAKILEFKKIENIYKVSVNFVSEIITCVKDKNNKVVEGNPDVIKTVSDVWKFSKNMWSQNPSWYLVDTSNK